MSDLLLMGAGSVQTAAAAANFGYFAGGTTGGYVATNDRLDFSADTTAQVTKAALSQARSGSPAGYNSLTLGYWSGGYTGAAVTTTDGLTFSTDTTAMVTKGVLTSAAFRSAAANSSTIGYTNLGEIGGETTTTNGLTFSSDTTAQVTKGALVAARSTMSAANSSTLGYWAGGATPNSDCYGLTFSTDTTAMVTKGALVTVRAWSAACNSSTLGYWSGGYTNGPGTILTTSTDGLTFSTDTTAMVTKGVLTQVTDELAAANSSTIGYFAGGGTTNGANYQTTNNGLTFSTDTTAMVTKGVLSQARLQLGACQTSGV